MLIPFRVAKPLSIIALAVVTTVSVIGCAPEGNSGGRLDPYASTESDQRSHKILLPQLLESTDTTVQELCAELVSIPSISSRAERMAFELGQVSNQTATPTSDFNLIKARLASRLRSSDILRNKFLFVENKGRVEESINHIGAGGQEGTATYKLKDTVILLCDFMEANRGGKRTYFYEFKLVKADTRELIYSRGFDLAQGH